MSGTLRVHQVNMLRVARGEVFEDRTHQCYSSLNPLQDR